MRPASKPILVTPPAELFEELPAGVLVTDAAGVVLAINRAAADTLGYTREEMVGKPFAAFADPGGGALHMPPAPLDARHGRIERWRLRHGTGRCVVIEARRRALDDGREVSVLEDVTGAADAERALLDTADQLQSVANPVPALIAYVDSEARYVWGNESYHRWFGQPPESIRGRHVSEVLGPSAWAAIRPYIERVLRGEEVTFDHRMVYKNGPPRDVRACYVPHVDADGRVRGFVGLVNDISAIRDAELALRRSEHMLEQSQLTAHVGSWEVTLPDETSGERRTLRWSDETFRIFGHEPGAIEPTYALFYDSIHPDDREDVRALSSAGLQRGEPFEKEYRVVRPDGSVRVVHAWTRFERSITGRPTRMLGTCQDITERRELERALRLSEERYRSLVEAITSVVWTSASDGRAVGAQPRWQAFTGQSTEELSGFGWSNAIHPDDRQAVQRRWDEALRTGVPYQTACRVWHAPSGGYRFCETKAVAIRNADGSIREWVGTLVDEHERERALQELREADRRKDEFLAMLAHELRNPLAPILNAVEVLERAAPDDAELTARFRTVIARQVQHMKRLLDDLLDVSRVSQGKIQLRKERVELGGLVLQAVEVSRPMIVQKRQQLAMTLAQGPLPLDADPTRLVQVFANLINNAAKYTDAGGHIAVSISTEGDEAVVTVRDDGMGMSPELLARAFDLFVQETRSLDRAQGGLGIGLTMVRTLVKMHGGSVRAFSDGPGRGSELVVRLPLVQVDKAPAAREPAAADRGKASPLRVLVVDDNVDAARALGHLLGLLGHRVTLAHDGPSALDAAAAAPPDLVLLDIGLPGMDGYTVAARLRAAGHKRAALVALTGYGQDEHLRRSSGAGFDQHLIKPVDFLTLRKLTDEIAPARQARAPRRRVR